MNFEILTLDQVKQKLKKQAYLCPIVYNDISNESFLTGCVILPVLITEQTNPLLFFCIALRYMFPFKEQGSNFIASLLFHGLFSTDVLTKEVLQFMNHQKTYELIEIWPQLMILYCLDKKRINTFFSTK